MQTQQPEDYWGVSMCLLGKLVFLEIMCFLNALINQMEDYNVKTALRYMLEKDLNLNLKEPILTLNICVSLKYISVE